MVRVNLVAPRVLSDQHLLAEYREILMLLGYVRKYDVRSTDAHFLKNPVKFFSDKLRFLARRHERLRGELKRRGFRHGCMPDLRGYARWRMQDFTPNKEQVAESRKRIIQRLRHPPRKGFYRFYGAPLATEELVQMARDSSG